MSERLSRRILTVVVFALAMAWVESAVVYYLRTMIDRIEPYQTNPLPIIGGLGPVELVREAATLIMLLTVGILSGKTGRERWAYAAIAFGVWDIGYYVFLKAMCGWPHSLLDWDILFLLPLPWWGPVLAPMMIAGLMILWGGLVVRTEETPASMKTSMITWGVNAMGMALALYVFMADTLRVMDGGSKAVRMVLPERFQWGTFSFALLLMSAPIWIFLRRGGLMRRALLQTRSRTAASGRSESAA